MIVSEPSFAAAATSLTTPLISAPATYEFDRFVVHAAADAAFVREYLLPALELPRSRVLLIDELPLGGPRETSGSISRGDPDQDRGIRLDPDRLAFAHALQVRGSKNGVAHELCDGDTLMTGDRMRLSVQTSEDAHLYLAFCARQELAVYPAKKGIRTRAGETVLVPQGSAELVVDSDPGPEVLYLILSREEISVADPRLAHALAAAGRNDRSVECGTSLDDKLAGSPGDGGASSTPLPGSAKAVYGPKVGTRPRASTHAPSRARASRSTISNAPRSGSGPSGAKRSPALADSGVSASALPAPDFERNFERNLGDVGWYRPDDTVGSGGMLEAGDDGIAVVRYTFVHVAQATPP